MKIELRTNINRQVIIMYQDELPHTSVPESIQSILERIVRLVQPTCIGM